MEFAVFWIFGTHNMQLSFDKVTSYALCALNRLAHASAGEGPLTASRIATECEVPEAVLRKALLALGHAGFVAGTRGVGYILGPRARQGSVLDVTDALNAMGPGGRGCFVKEGPCPSEDTCPIRSVCGEIRDSLRRRLAAIPLASLPSDGRGFPFCFRKSAA